MSDEALEAVLGEPEHAKKYDLDSYQSACWRLLYESQEARGLVDAARRRGGALLGFLEQPAAKRKRGD